MLEGKQRNRLLLNSHIEGERAKTEMQISPKPDGKEGQRRCHEVHKQMKRKKGLSLPLTGRSMIMNGWAFPMPNNEGKRKQWGKVKLLV